MRPMFSRRRIVRAIAGRRISAQLLKPLLGSGPLEGLLIVEAGNLKSDDSLRALFETSEGLFRRRVLSRQRRRYRHPDHGRSGVVFAGDRARRTRLVAKPPRRRSRAVARRDREVGDLLPWPIADHRRQGRKHRRRRCRSGARTDSRSRSRRPDARPRQRFRPGHRVRRKRSDDHLDNAALFLETS